MPGSLLTVGDYRKEATSRLPKLARDYYNGGSENEETLRRNEKAYDSFLIRPRCFRDVSTIDIKRNNKLSAISIAPTAFHKMAFADGELATAKAAAKSGTLMIASSWSTTPLEEIAAEINKYGGTLWFQLYVYKDRTTTQKLIKRAEQAGCKAIVLTVDTPVLGRRLADLRNAFTLPKPLDFANFKTLEKSKMPNVAGGDSGLMNYVSTQVESCLDWNLIKWIKSNTHLPVIVKGVMRGDDAEEAVEHGVDGIIVSNHGGRQLDSAPGTIEALNEVVKAVKGRCPVYVDGGIRNGRDVFKALALGAEAVFIGRPVLWGLAVKGEDGVSNILEILSKELSHTMQLAGVRDLSELRNTPNLVVHQSYFSKL